MNQSDESDVMEEMLKPGKFRLKPSLHLQGCRLRCVSKAIVAGGWWRIDLTKRHSAESSWSGGGS